MSKKETMVKRKLSFDIPKLKIGSRSQSKSREQTPNAFDSPPVTPKSVRPPLSPKTDNQLRLACAYVLQDFKPSHQLYEERYGKQEDEKPRLSYPVAPKPEEKRDGGSTLPLIRKLSHRARSSRGRGREVSETGGSADPKMKPTIKSQAFFEGLHIDSNTLDGPPIPGKTQIDQMVDEEIRADLLSLNPPIASPAFFAGVDVNRLRKEQFAAIPLLDPPKPSETVETKLARPLKRSVSNPISPKPIIMEHPRHAPRSESADTTASSPRTEGTEHVWNDSTAPTSTAVTPARGSMRGSSQHVGTEKFLIADIEWMREELDRHRKAQDEVRAQQELTNQVIASLGLDVDSRLSRHGPLPLSQLPLRQDSLASSRTALGRGRSTSQSIQQRRNVPPVPHLDSVQSKQLARSESRRQRSAPHSESGHELDMLRPESRQSRPASRDSEAPSRQRSISREIRDYFKSSSTDALTDASANVSRASSRSRRLFQINGRSRDGTRQPPASLESSKPPSRSRSIESIRSAVSAVAPSIDSATSKFRSWKSSSRRQDSSSKKHDRDSSGNTQKSPDSRKSKQDSVNLNRELPPLPSLDQWKPPEEEKPKHIVSMASPRIGSLRMSSGASASDPNLLSSQPPLSPVRGTGTGSSSRIQSIYSRYAKMTDSWIPEQAPRYSALASPTVPPELMKPIVDQDLSSPTLPPETHDAGDDRDLASPTLPPEIIHTGIDQEFDFAESTQHASLPASPAYAVVDPNKNRIPSEYMFRPNLGAVTVPMAPPPIPASLNVPAKTIRRRTEDMFLPDLDAKVRGTTSPSGATGPPSKDNIVSHSRSVKKPPNKLRRQNTAPVGKERPTEISAPISHTKTPSEQINFSRKPSTDNYSKLYDMGYRNIVPIQASAPVAESKATAQLPQRKESKRWWKRGTSKRIKSPVVNDNWSGTVAADESAPTVVRF